MKRIIYVASNDEFFSYPIAYSSLQQVIQFKPRRIVKVFIEIPIDEEDTIAEEVKV